MHALQPAYEYDSVLYIGFVLVYSSEADKNRIFVWLNSHFIHGFYLNLFDAVYSHISIYSDNVFQTDNGAHLLKFDEISKKTKNEPKIETKESQQRT